MPILESNLDTGSAACAANRAAWLKLIDDFRALEQRVRDASAKAKPVFDKRGQLLPRERVARALDAGSPFLELSTVAGWCLDNPDPEKTIPGGGLVAGIGYVSGVRCLVAASDSGIDAGAIQPMGLEKILRVLEIAKENKLPFLHLVESAGANLLKYRVEDFIHGGGLFCGLTRLSAAGIPVVTVVHGSSTAGGAYMPGMSDYVVMVRGRAKAFLAGQALLKAATGEDASEEELGGAEMHATVSGLAEYLAEDDADGIRLAREVLAKLDWNRDLRPQQKSVRAPRRDIDELLGLVPLDTKKPYDVREVIARLVDDSDFHEFKARYGTTLVCGFARIHGIAVGIVANNGILFGESAQKGAHFVELCAQRGIPLLFLQNITGFMVGRKYENQGIAKDGAKMVTAVACAKVPKFTVIIGGSFGAGNYGMCGRAY